MLDPQPSPLPWEKRKWSSIYLFDATGSMVCADLSEPDADLILSTFARVARLEEALKEARHYIANAPLEDRFGNDGLAEVGRQNKIVEIDTALAEGKDSPQ